jgi:hypothetical protein
MWNIGGFARKIFRRPPGNSGICSACHRWWIAAGIAFVTSNHQSGKPHLWCVDTCRRRIDGPPCFSGFFGAVVSTIMLIPSKLFFAAEWEKVRQGAEQQLAKTPETAGPMRDLFLRAMSAEVSFTTEMFWFFFYGFSFSLFAMLGGMLMVWISNRRKKKRIQV